MSRTITAEARLRRVLSGLVRPAQAAIRRAVLRMVDSAVLLTPVAPDPNRVLLVRLDNIGDFVVWLDAGRALAEHYRAEGRQVTLLGSASWASFAEELGIFDEVLSLDQRSFKQNLRYRRSLLVSLRKAGFGVVIQPTMSRVPEMGDAVVRASGATERIGVESVARPAKGGRQDALYTKLIAADAKADGEMQANAWFVRELTGTGYQARVADLAGVFGAECLGELVEELPAMPYVVLFPGASAAGRQWPAERFAALARRCVEEFACAVVLCGGPGDVQTADAAAKAAGAGVITVAGRTSLQQLTAVIAGAQLVVSNETSAVHLAAAVGVASVCILGGGHFGRFVPYAVGAANGRPVPLAATRSMECFGCNWVCKFHPARGKPMPCIEEVSVDTVWSLAAPLCAPRMQEVEA